MSSYYMKESTYKHDFVPQSKGLKYNRMDKPVFYNTPRYNQYYDPDPRGPRDDTRLPLNQERGYNDYRQDGPYTDRGGYYINDYEHYNDRQYTERPYGRRDDQYRGSSDRQYDRRDEQYRGSPDRMYDRRNISPERMDRRDQLNRSPERGYNGHPYDHRGPQTDRPEYRRADYQDGPYTDRGHQMHDANRPFGINRTTQKDYGAMYERRGRPADRMYDRRNMSPDREIQQQMERMEFERPTPYRGHLNQENEHFHIKNHGNNRPEHPPAQQSNRRDYPSVHQNDRAEYPKAQQPERSENQNVQPKEFPTEKGRYMEEEYIDQAYIRPEESKQVRQRNLQQAHDRPQGQHQANTVNEYNANVSQISTTGEVFLFIRAKNTREARDDITKSFKKHKSTLQREGGSVVGMAPSDMVYIDGDTSDWKIKSVTKLRDIQWYKGDHDIYCLRFSSMAAADNWVVYNQDFKIAKFPDPDGADIVIVPINYDLDLRSRTFVMTFYPKIINDGLRNYIEQKKTDMEKKWNCYAFVASTLKTNNKRGSWLTGNSNLVSLHAFNSLDDADSYEEHYRSERVGERLRDFTRNGVHTTMMFQLQSYP